MIRYFEFNFSSAHRYNQPQWDEKKNKEVFGACYNPFGHGHNYRLVVGVEWTKDSPEALLVEKIKNIVAGLDHRHLNHEVPEFKSTIPTTENIALYLAKKINTALPTIPLRKVRLYEMDELWAEVDCE